MLPSTHLLPVPFWVSKTYTTSEISDTGTPPFSIVRRMHQLDSYLEFLGWKRRQRTKPSEQKKTPTGLHRIRPKKTELAVDADVIRTSGM